ncbi:MAG: hypothetical protein JXB32_02485 [Deltaproteobacteria bacterium]|nr:hypothetical protein [Deltaproteobacteria bacterium]
MGDLKLQFLVRPGPAADACRFAADVVDRLAPLASMETWHVDELRVRSA